MEIRPWYRTWDPYSCRSTEYKLHHMRNKAYGKQQLSRKWPKDKPKLVHLDDKFPASWRITQIITNDFVCSTDNFNWMDLWGITQCLSVTYLYRIDMYMSTGGSWIKKKWVSTYFKPYKRTKQIMYSLCF